MRIAFQAWRFICLLLRYRLGRNHTATQPDHCECSLVCWPISAYAFVYHVTMLIHDMNTVYTLRFSSLLSNVVVFLSSPIERNSLRIKIRNKLMKLMPNEIEMCASNKTLRLIFLHKKWRGFPRKEQAITSDVDVLHFEFSEIASRALRDVCTV